MLIGGRLSLPHTWLVEYALQCEGLARGKCNNDMLCLSVGTTSAYLVHTNAWGTSEQEYNVCREPPRDAPDKPELDYVCLHVRNTHCMEGCSVGAEDVIRWLPRGRWAQQDCGTGNESTRVYVLGVHTVVGRRAQRGVPCVVRIMCCRKVHVDPP